MRNTLAIRKPETADDVAQVHAFEVDGVFLPVLGQDDRAHRGFIGIAFLSLSGDATDEELVDGFTRKTFTAMIEGVRESAIKAGLAEEQDFEEGIRDLYRTAERDGVFCYTFFKAVALKRDA